MKISDWTLGGFEFHTPAIELEDNVLPMPAGTEIGFNLVTLPDHQYSPHAAQNIKTLLDVAFESECGTSFFEFDLVCEDVVVHVTVPVHVELGPAASVDRVILTVPYV